MQSRSLGVALGLVLVVSLGGCGGQSRPNIILVTVDTLRADRLSPYGYQGVATPHVAQLAADGIVFEQSIADASWTLPSVASVLTGKYSFTHGVLTIYDRLVAEHTTVAEILRGEGYHTAAIVASYPLDRRFGFEQGFDVYDDEMTTPLATLRAVDEGEKDREGNEQVRWMQERVGTRAYRPDDEVADRAIEWLGANPPEPFLLWVHFFGPHEKPARDAEKMAGGATMADLYDRDVETLDAQVGRVMAALDDSSVSTQTAVLFHSDHGQTLEEHSPSGHGFDVFETTVHVPLIIRLPGRVRAGERVEGLVRNLDIFPTILSLAQAETPPRIAGVDLFAPAESRPGHAHVSTHFFVGLGRDVEIGGETLRVGTATRGIRTARWKLVVREPVIAANWAERDAHTLPADYVARARRIRLYDLANDELETKNVAKSHPAVVERLQALLEKEERGAKPQRATAPLDDEARQRLRALGYLDDER